VVSLSFIKEKLSHADHERDFDAQALFMITAPLPSIFARKAFKARTLLHAQFRDWYNAGYCNDSDVSLAATARMDVNRKYNIAANEIAEDNMGLLFVSTTNAMPTLFWLFLNVFSSPNLVEDLRAEIQTVLTKTVGNKVIIDHTKFSSNCPLLCSAYQETMRLTNIQASTRYIAKDTILTSDNREYLLKEGALVQTPASIFHILPSTWGADVETFNPRRFMDLSNSKADKNMEKLQKKSFIPFGGGKHLCPGRHFAFAEVLGIIALLVIGFEIEGVNGKPVENFKGVRSIVNAVLQPGERGLKSEIKIRRREGWEKTQWSFVE